ncbi:hypothetical protein [Rothia sp. P5766]|uniref:hypothetical protein n=1 Tax=unclassified Rothia (in: high G+C Gram-positive bacteria) TaxID=2689056 RepID=UPI003AC16C3F
MAKLQDETISADSTKDSTTDVSLDPEFEAELAATLACDPTERIERLSRLVQSLQDELDKHGAPESKEL